jgi:hypothetical protein
MQSATICLQPFLGADIAASDIVLPDETENEDVPFTGTDCAVVGLKYPVPGSWL